MKKFLMSSVVAAILIASLMAFVKKKNEVCGNWQLLECSGGFTGKGPGWDLSKKIIFSFSPNGRFKMTVDGVERETDKYCIKKNQSSIFGSDSNLLDYKQKTDQVYRVNGDSLFLSENVNDGFSFVLLKAKR